MAATPTVKVEINFSGSTWTDVTAYWDAKRPITMTGGRADTDERVAPGRLSGLVLNNSDGRFTVGYTSGAYYPNVVSGRKVRISIKDPASTTYHDRFVGRIDGWPLHWEDNGNTCWVTLSATDMLGDLTQAVATAAWLQSVHASLTHYWPLTDRGPISYPTVGDVPMISVGDYVESGRVEGPPADPTPVRLNTTGYQIWEASLAGASATDTQIWQCAFRASSDVTTSAGYVIRVFCGADVAQVGIGTDGVLYMAVSRATGANPGTDTWSTSVNVRDGGWWVVQFKLYFAAPNYKASLYAYRLDDEGTSAAYSSATISTNRYLPTGERRLRAYVGPGLAVGHMSVGDTGTFSTFAYQFAGLPTEAISDWATRYNSVWGGDTAVTATLAPGPAVMNWRPVADDYMGLWHQLEDVDGGLLHCTRSGVISYLESTYRTSHAEGVLLSLTPTDLATEWAVAADIVDLVNDVTVVSRDTLAGDITVQIEDAASITARGRKRYSREVWGGRSLPAVAAVASRFLRPTEAPRVPQFTVDVMALTNAQQLAVLGLDLLDQVGVTDLPTAGGFDTKWLGRVEGWSETVAIDQWSITFNTSFAGNSLGDATHGLILGSNRLA